METTIRATAMNSSDPNQREGMVFRSGLYVELPEMAISFAQGFLFQAWVRQETLQDGYVFMLGGQDAQIACCAMRDGSIVFTWVDAKGLVCQAAKKDMLKAAKWNHLTVQFADDGIAFFCNGQWAPPDNAMPGAGLPKETARTGNVLGSGVGGGKGFAGTIADVRIWNRSFGSARPGPASNKPRDVIRNRALRDLAGDESGLVGHWTLEGPRGIQDNSRFGRHGTMVGGTFQAGSSSFTIGPVLANCFDFGASKGRGKTDTFALDGNGFTWQAQIFARDASANVVLLSLNAGKFGDRLEVSLASGVVSASFTQNGVAKKISTPSVVVGNVWTSLALQVGPDGTMALYVGGAIVGTPTMAYKIRAGEYQAQFGVGFNGLMAELRLWTRTLTAGEIADTGKRRIHGWAPALIGSWRLDDDLVADEAINGNPSGPRAMFTDVTSASRGRLELGMAPMVTPPRVASISGQINLPALPAIGENGFSIQLWLNLNALEPMASILSTSGMVTLYRDQGYGGTSQTLTAGRYDLWQLSVGNDQISSAKVPPGMRVVLYENANFQGNSVRFDKDASSLGTAMNDKASSLVVESTMNLSLRAMNSSLLLEFPTATNIARLEVPNLFDVQRWTHVTVTVDAEGLACVYKDGKLVARQDFPSPLSLSLTPWLGALKGSVSELRVWSRALNADEVTRNWRTRVVSGGGLVARWALSGDLSGQTAAGTGTVLWREAPALPLVDQLGLAKPTILSRCSLLADQTGAGKRPQLCIDLTAVDALGVPCPNVDVNIVIQDKLPIFRTSMSPGNQISTPQNFTLKTGARGDVRFVFEALGLGAPIVRVRSSRMEWGDWVLITPDQIIHETLAAITATELTKGRRATSTTKPGAKGLIPGDGDKLVKLLRGMLGPATTFSFEQQSTAALAFNEAEGDNIASDEPLHVLTGPHGDSLVAPMDAPLVRRLGATALVPGGGDDGAALSFGLIDDGIEFIADVVQKVAKTAMETVENVGAWLASTAIVKSITVKVNTLINGISVVANYILSTVEEAIDAVADVFKKIGKAIGEVLDFLADLFDWTDILQTADALYDQMLSGVATAKGKTAELVKSVRDGLTSFEANVIQAMGGVLKAPAEVAEKRKESKTFQLPQPPNILEFLLSLLPDDLTQVSRDIAAVFAPVSKLISNALARLPAIGDGLAQEWNGGALQAALKDPAKFLDSDPSEWLELARMFVRLVFNAVKLLIDFAGDALKTTFDVVDNLLKLRLDIPVLTAFVEKNVLGGKSMTMGRLLALIPAIVATVLYKLVTGKSDGPFAGSALQNFAETTAADKLGFVNRIFGVVIIFVGGIRDMVDVFAKDDSSSSPGDATNPAPANPPAPATPTVASGPKAWDVIWWAARLINSSLNLATLIANEVGQTLTTWQQQARRWLNILGWFIGVVELAVDLGFMIAKKEGDKVTNVIALFGNGTGLVAGIFDVCIVAKDEKTSKSDVAISSLDMVTNLGETIAAAGMVAPKNPQITPFVVGGGHLAATLAAASAAIVDLAT